MTEDEAGELRALRERCAALTAELARRDGVDAQAAAGGATKYRALFEAMDEGFCIIEFIDGPDGPLSDYVHVDANAAYERNAGIADVVGQRVRAMVPDEADEWVERYRRVLDTGEPARFQQELVATGRHLELAAFRLEPASRREVAVLFQDVTARHRAEAELSEVAERLSLATDHAEIGSWDVDPINDRLIWPARTKAMFGISPDVPVSMQDFYAGLHPDDLAATSAAYDAAVDPDRRALYDIEYRTIGKEDGVVRWVAAKGRGLFDDSGRCVRVLGTAIDITARKRDEERLRDLNEDLETRVVERTAELNAAHELLRQAQKIEAVGQLTGGLAHDFNNLLTVIRGSVDLLRRAGLSDARKARYVDAIADTADRAARLTHQLLAFARRQSLTPETFDARATVAALRDMIVTLTGSRTAIEIDTGDGPAMVHVDRNQLDTAIINMAANGRDAMGGEGVLTIAVRRVDGIPAVRLHPALAGDFVTVAITDTGEGIPADRLDHIFEPFFTTKAVGNGTGLGLSQVFGFAKQSGGEVLVDSEVGRGTTFTLYLPAAPGGHVSAPSDQPVERAAAGGGKCILVVEDNAEVGSFARSALAELGYTTVLATDAAQALAELDTAPERFDLVFSDVVMPGMSGIELGHEIRRRHPALPVVLTSGYSTLLADEGSHGFDLVRKPYSVDLLAGTIHKAVDGRS